MPEERPQRPDAPDSVRDVQSTTVRWDETIHRLIMEAAAEKGMSFAQYVEEAALARLFFDAGVERRGELAKQITEAARLAQQVSPRRRRPKPKG